MPSERCDAAENRKRILAVAKHLLAGDRLDERSTQEIARAAGVGQGTLYRRFADKGELCEALFADDLEVFRERDDAHLDGALSTPALLRLEWLLTEKIRFVDAHLPLFLAAHEVAGARRYDVFRKSHHTWTRERVVRLLEEAQASGEAQLQLGDVAFTADAVLASFAAPLLAYQRRELGARDRRSYRRICGGLRRGAQAGNARSQMSTEAAAPV